MTDKKQVSISIEHLEAITRLVLTDWEKERVKAGKKNITFAEIMDRYIRTDPRVYGQVDRRKRFVSIDDLRGD